MNLKCAACGSKQKRNMIGDHDRLIVCQKCGKPLLFEDKVARALDSITLTAKMRRLLGGKPQDMQGVVLADLLAMWIAGHISKDGDDEKTDGYRELILRVHIAAVRALIPVNYKLYVEPALKATRH